VQHILQADRVLIYRLWPDGTGSSVAEAVQGGLPR
jgi:light-regulated signal transduction histidine kinase (bacteriophytochrome)